MSKYRTFPLSQFCGTGLFWIFRELGAMRPRDIFSAGDSPSTINSENWVYILKGADGLPYKMAA